MDLTKEHSINSATVKYTDFLLATASGKIEGLKGPGKLATPFEKTKISAYTLGAMTPCMRLYAVLGKKFQELLHSDEGTHPYNKWIDNYSSDGFQVCHIDSRAIPYCPCGCLDTILNLGQIYILVMAFLHPNYSVILIFEFRLLLCKLKICLTN